MPKREVTIAQTWSRCLEFDHHGRVEQNAFIIVIFVSEVEFKKQREGLLAKRVELKSDRKARAMASRTKDNFRGYNGIPVVETPKKRRTKQEMQQDQAMNEDRFRNNSIDPEDDEDNYEYEETDSEPEPEAQPLRPGKNIGHIGSGSSNSGKPSSKKPTGPPRPPQSAMNFADLLKLAEKKQFEPVEVKPKVVRKEERLRTADEIKELEMERKAKRQGKDGDSNVKREKDHKSQSSSSSLRKGTSEREQKSCKPQKNSSEKPNLPSGSGKKSHHITNTDKGHSSSKSSVGDRDRPQMSQSDRARAKTTLSGSSGAINSKVSSKIMSSQISAKQHGPMPSASHRSSTSSDLSFKKEASSFLQGRTSAISGTRPSAVAGQKSQHRSSQQTRPGQGSSAKQGPTIEGQRPGKGEPLRPGTSSVVKSSGSSTMRPSSGGPPKAGNQLQTRPGATHQANARNVPQTKPGGRSIQGHLGVMGSRPPGSGPGRPGAGGPVPGRSNGSVGSGPGRPKCTVVSETISSKNVGGPRLGVPPRPGMPQRPGMPPRPGMAPRPMMSRPPGKNQREDYGIISQ